MVAIMVNPIAVTVGANTYVCSARHAGSVPSHLTYFELIFQLLTLELNIRKYMYQERF